MRHYAFAIAAALLWAASVPLINRAYRAIPKAAAAPATATGLLVALVTASTAFAAIVLVGRIDIRFSWSLCLAGIMTYPVATGCYYFGAYLFGGRAEASAQFARVKPIFSVAFALAIAGERPGHGSIVACAILAIGVMIIVIGNLRSDDGNRTRDAAVAVGLGAALAWALGELFMKLAGPRHGFAGNVAAAAVMVWSGTLAFLPALPFLIRWRASIAPGPWLTMFSLHGLISYATAYLCFFASLAHLGLARTVAVTAAWPLVSILTAALERRTTGQRTTTPRYLIVASSILLVGAIIEIWFGG